jgi:hypothetical protein
MYAIIHHTFERLVEDSSSFTIVEQFNEVKKYLYANAVRAEKFKEEFKDETFWLPLPYHYEDDNEIIKVVRDKELIQAQEYMAKHESLQSMNFLKLQFYKSQFYLSQLEAVKKIKQPMTKKENDLFLLWYYDFVLTNKTIQDNDN